MPRIGARRLHRWVALTTGVFMLVWIGTGVIMLVPVDELRRWIPSGGAVDVDGAGEESTGAREDRTGRGEERTGPNEGPTGPRIRDARVSVAQVIDAVEREVGGSVTVVGVRLDRLGDRIAFTVELAGGDSRLVDASDGSIIRVDAQLAEVVARTAVPDSGPVRSSSLLESPVYFYDGPMPAYRVAFDDPRRSVVYVSAVNGRVERVHSSWSRLHELVIGMHTFQPIRWLAVSSGVQAWVLVLVSLVAAIAVLSGFWLGLPARWRRFRRGAGAPESESLD